MPISSIHCPVAHADVVRVTDLEGVTLRVICPEYEEPGGACRLKQHAGQAGPLGALLERAQEGSLSASSVRCSLA
jgi:hypothetical protein